MSAAEQDSPTAVLIIDVFRQRTFYRVFPTLEAARDQRAVDAMDAVLRKEGTEIDNCLKYTIKRPLFWKDKLLPPVPRWLTFRLNPMRVRRVCWPGYMTDANGKSAKDMLEQFKSGPESFGRFLEESTLERASPPLEEIVLPSATAEEDEDEEKDQDIVGNKYFFGKIDMRGVCGEIEFSTRDGKNTLTTRITHAAEVDADDENLCNTLAMIRRWCSRHNLHPRDVIVQELKPALPGIP